ncbi:hypothetical protein [Frigoribacterium sp. Leaf263]|uniref:hypothetical protein n=1 Tax=Frigoribacterium sp. Leaf263 TaxID=1736313 RepID=UPI000B13564B|nr:hypothetical protein [Frigoribacterium sp. Leaf263]
MILPRRTMSRAVLGVAVGVCLVGLSACTNSSVHEADLPLPEKNRHRWLLPLDQYQWPLVDPVSDAEQVIVASCLSKVGYEWRVVPTEDGASPQESWSDAGRKLFSVELAEKYGYGNSPMLDQAPARMDADRANRAVSQQHPEAVDACFEEAAPILGIVDGSAYDLAQQIGNLAYAEAEQAVEVRDAASDWRTCMKDAGLPDLPDVPEEMPPASVDTGDDGDGIDAPFRTGDELDVPAEVRRVAVADATCRDSTGYTSTFYDAEWDAQVEAMGSRIDVLERFKQQAEEQRALAERYLAENAVSQ